MRRRITFCGQRGRPAVRQALEQLCYRTNDRQSKAKHANLDCGRRKRAINLKYSENPNAFKSRALTKVSIARAALSRPI